MATETPAKTIDVVIEERDGQTVIVIPDGVSKADARKIGEAIAGMCGSKIVGEEFGGDLAPDKKKGA